MIIVITLIMIMILQTKQTTVRHMADEEGKQELLVLARLEEGGCEKGR